MKWKCYIDTCYDGIIVKANETVVDADSNAFLGNTYWYQVEKKDAVKTPSKPRMPKFTK